MINLQKYTEYWQFLRRYVYILLAVFVCLSIFATYNLIFGEKASSGVANHEMTIAVIVIDLILLLALSILIIRKLFWHKSQEQSGKLQSKIILMFSLVAVVPTIIITVFSTIFFNFGIQSWFDQRVSVAINESVVVAESYFRVQLKLIESDVIVMSNDLNYLAGDETHGPESLSYYLTKQADDKGLIEAVIFRTDTKKIIAQSKYNLAIPFVTLSHDVLSAAEKGVPVVTDLAANNKVHAIVKLSFMPNCYLLIGRIVDQKVLEHMDNTKGAASDYERLKGRISKLQIEFLIIFIAVSLLLLFAAIWLGLVLSSALIKPLNKLVSATEQITEGNFNINIDTKNTSDEIISLARAFKIMASELNNQRVKLIDANYEIQAKHHFNETILSGVSAGIVALDLNYRISMINPSAIHLLSLNKDIDLINRDFSEISPEISAILTHAQDIPGREVKKEIVINQENRSLILIVKIITERILDKTQGYIITFDDVTALVLAQRSAAWSDVARRIAHEIKNPLTPIHLAAERLRKKYSNEVADTQNFSKYLEIIVKHVKDIGAIVEEFVQFARMPSPKFETTNLSQLVREAIFSRKCLDKNIRYITEIEMDPIEVNCDARQISQVLLNLLKNAEEAIEQSDNAEWGEITLRLLKQDDLVELDIIDNGGGFPLELFDRLTEPYITNKSTGTGLGLAIVKKILDDHNIDISFANNNQQGAVIKLIFKGIK